MLIPAISVAFIVTVACMFAIHPFALKIGLIDSPGGHKRHDGEVPVIGGIAMLIGMTIGLFLLAPPAGGFLSAFLAGSLLVAIGVIDDRVGLPPATRMMTQVAVVLIMIFGANLQLVDIGDPFGTGVISMGGLSLIFTLVVVVTMINAYNLIDGLDGLSGSMAIIALVAVATVAGTGNVFGAAALTLSASIIGFLVFNYPVKWNRSVRSFMGDAGSTLLGLAVVWVTLGVAQGEGRIISPVHCLWFAALPIFDCLACFVKRVRKGVSPFESARDHAHHMLRRGGFGVRGTVAVLTGMQVFYACCGVAGYFAGIPDVVMFTAWSVFGISHRIIIHRIARSHRLHRMTAIRRRNFA